MKRKILKLGNVTYVASLPIKWMRKYNLQKGDYIEVEEQEGSLLLSTDKHVKFSSIEVALPSKDQFLPYLVYTPYRFGYDEITFTFKDPSILPEIQKCTDLLMGFEIVDQGQKHCTLRNISAQFEQEYENIFKRCFMVLINLFSESIEILESKELQRFSNLPSQEIIMDKLSFFCERVLNKRGNNDFTKNSLEYITIWTLEQLGDGIKNVSKMMAEMKSVSPAILRSFKGMLPFFKAYYQLYYKPSLDSVHSVKEKYAKLHAQLTLDLKKSKGEETIILHTLLTMTNKVNNLALSVHL